MPSSLKNFAVKFACHGMFGNFGSYLDLSVICYRCESINWCFVHSGYDGSEWEDYPRYVNHEGVEMTAVSCLYISKAWMINVVNQARSAGMLQINIELN